MTAPGSAPQRSLGRVLYRQPPDSGIARVAVVAILFSIPWLLVPLFRPGLETCLIATVGVVAGGAVARGLEACLRRRQNDAIHERGIRIRIDGRPTVLWFTGDVFITEVQEFLRDYGAATKAQWVFELRAGDAIATLATDAPRAAHRIREAFTRATGHPPARPRRT